jgi:hypothetical protein
MMGMLAAFGAISLSPVRIGIFWAPSLSNRESPFLGLCLGDQRPQGPRGPALVPECRATSKESKKVIIAIQGLKGEHEGAFGPLETKSSNAAGPKMQPLVAAQPRWTLKAQKRCFH